MHMARSMLITLDTTLKRLHVLFFALLLSACAGEAEESGLKLEATTIGEKTIDHNGRIVTVHDVQLSIQNQLKETPLFISTLDTTYQSEYLKTRNPGKFSYTLEKLNGTKWQDTNGGYGGTATRAWEMAPGFKVEFTVPIPVDLTGGAGTYRLRVSFADSDKKGAKRHTAYSNEFEI